MKELRFYGGSDDLFECEGAIREEVYCYNEPGVYHLKSSEGEMKVIGYYMESGIWSVGVSQVDECAPIPKWPASYSQAHEYSSMLTLQVPNDTVLVQGNEEDD
jgi:hypothetical protein